MCYTHLPFCDASFRPLEPLLTRNPKGFLLIVVPFQVQFLSLLMSEINGGNKKNGRKISTVKFHGCGERT